MNVYRLGEDSHHDIDHAILIALLRGRQLSPVDQLDLVLTWNRADIARSEVFTVGQDWPPGMHTRRPVHACTSCVGALDTAMFRALVENRVAFVDLLLEQGVVISQFLTMKRMEDLYNSNLDPVGVDHIVNTRVVGVT
jgi:hypothetical protein